MITVKLSDPIYKELHILDKVEYSKNQYRGIDANAQIRFSFLPGYGTTLFYENRHYIVIDSKKPVKRYQIWRNHKIIGECNITKEAAEKANKATNAEFYFSK